MFDKYLLKVLLTMAKGFLPCLFTVEHPNNENPPQKQDDGIADCLTVTTKTICIDEELPNCSATDNTVQPDYTLCNTTTVQSYSNDLGGLQSDDYNQIIGVIPRMEAMYHSMVSSSRLTQQAVEDVVDKMDQLAVNQWKMKERQDQMKFSQYEILDALKKLEENQRSTNLEITTLSSKLLGSQTSVSTEIQTEGVERRNVDTQTFENHGGLRAKSKLRRPDKFCEN